MSGSPNPASESAVGAGASAATLRARATPPRGRHDATRGHLGRVVLALAVPILGVMVLETVRSAAELKFLGMLGTSAFDTVITVNQTFHQLFFTFVIATAWGASALVAQRMGARDLAEAGRTMGQSVALVISVGVVAGLVALLGTDAVLRGIGMGESAPPEAATYLRCIGMISTLPFLTFCLSVTLQATGDVITPLLMVVIGATVNVLCNWLFIFGIGPLPALGPVGIVCGQLGGALASVLVAVIRIRRFHADLGLHLRTFFVHEWPRVVRIARLAWPVWLQIMCRAVGIIFIIRLVGAHGELARTGYGVAMRLDLMLINLGMAFAGAAATITGQNKGAGELRRAAVGPWVAWLYYAGALSLFTGLFWWNAEGVLGFFTQDAEVIAVGAAFLRISSAVYPFFAAAFVFSRAMQGAGDMWRPTIITLFITFGVFIPLALWLPDAMGWGVRGIFIASAISMVIAGILQTAAFLRGGWRGRSA